MFMDCTTSFGFVIAFTVATRGQTGRSRNTTDLSLGDRPRCRQATVHASINATGLRLV